MGTGVVEKLNRVGFIIYLIRQARSPLHRLRRRWRRLCMPFPILSVLILPWRSGPCRRSCTDGKLLPGKLNRVGAEKLNKKLK